MDLANCCVIYLLLGDLPFEVRFTFLRTKWNLIICGLKYEQIKIEKILCPNQQSNEEKVHHDVERGRNVSQHEGEGKSECT